MRVEIEVTNSNGEKDYWVNEYMNKKYEDNYIHQSSLSEILAAVEDYKLCNNWN